MLKKIFVFSVMLASMAFAGNPYGYGSSEDADAAAGVLEQNKASAENQSVVSQTQYEDKKFALVFHPMSTIIDGAQGVFTFYLNFEAGFGSFFSLISRPFYMNGTNNGVTASGFGIEEGFRFYVSGKGHKGWYVEPELWFASVDASNSRVSATGLFRFCFLVRRNNAHVYLRRSCFPIDACGCLFCPVLGQLFV